MCVVPTKTTDSNGPHCTEKTQKMVCRAFVWFKTCMHLSSLGVRNMLQSSSHLCQTFFWLSNQKTSTFFKQLIQLAENGLLCFQHRLQHKSGEVSYVEFVILPDDDGEESGDENDQQLQGTSQESSTSSLEEDACRLLIFYQLDPTRYWMV